MPTIAELRTELDRVRAMEADWKARGAPEPEGAGVRAYVKAAEQSLANAIGDGEDPWAARVDAVMAKAAADGGGDDSNEIEMPPENMRREIEMPPENMRRPQTHATPVQAHAAKVAHKRSQRKPPRPARASKDVLNKETDARFWAQSGYKVGQKLNPSNPADRAMMKLWLDIFHKVEAEDETGHLVTTWDHPEVANYLQEATAARQVAEDHLEQAAAAPDPWEQTRHAETAANANAVSQKAAKEAAKYQPPTASPHVAQTAANDAHAATNKPPPGVKVFPKGHPIHWRPSAQPSNQAFNTPNAPDTISSTHPTNAADELALGNAASAPQRTADLHEDEASRDGETANNNSGGGSTLPKFGNKKTEKTKSGIAGKIALAIGGVAALGGIGYAIWRNQKPSRGPSGTMRMPRMPRAPGGPRMPAVP